MTAEGAIEFEALEALAASAMELFGSAGYERVAPSFIQPASLFLDRIGEELRARTYVFTDPDGQELCLRPEMTIPVCRVFLERDGEAPAAKFCYNGPAFRIQHKPDPLSPREFRQAGIEHFGSAGRSADAEVLGLTVAAVRRSGVRFFTIKAGHLGLFTALLDALEMPQRWRERLARSFWRPKAFARELATLSQASRRAAIGGAGGCADTGRPVAHLEAQGIAFLGRRSAAEIAKRLQDKAADARETPLPQETVSLIENYLHVSGPVPAALDAAEALLVKGGVSLGGAFADARALFADLQAAAGAVPIQFDAGFGRDFEYYTGMVFQIETASAGHGGRIAGGGRYDRLIRALSGGRRDVPAVGAALHTERLLAASRRR